MCVCGRLVGWSLPVGTLTRARQALEAALQQLEEFDHPLFNPPLETLEAEELALDNAQKRGEVRACVWVWVWVRGYGGAEAFAVLCVGSRERQR